MAVSRESLVSPCICVVFVVVSSIRCVSSTSMPMPMPMPMSPLLSESALLLHRIKSKCPISFSLNPLLQVNGYFLDRTLTSKRGNVYTAVLFHASWCQFSHEARLIFEALSFMFPQIEHLTVEQSSVMPSVFSRYGIHSFPTILMVNQTSRMRFRGSKDLHSLVKFYEEVTEFEPVHYVAVDHSTSLENSGRVVMQSLKGSSLNEIVAKEPYLLFSMLFLCLRVLVFLIPKVVFRFRPFWASYVPHLNLEMFGETSQIWGRVLHMLNVKRIWAKLRLWKTRNFREGTRNARVWASSLASVSLGETSSLRSTS